MNPAIVEPIRRSVGYDANGVEMETLIGRMAAVSIAGHRLEPRACAVVDLAPFKAAVQGCAEPGGIECEPIDVVLGMPAIAQADWWFDFPGRRWSVARG